MSEWHITNVEEDVWGPCGVCGESIHKDEEVGEFVKPNGQHILAHSQCGLNANLPTA